MKYSATKRFNPGKGYPCVFRQWRADSHCRFWHGYDLIFEVTFETDELDRNGWTVDFGGLAYLKKRIEDNFDHKMIIAEDDPEYQFTMSAEPRGLMKPTVLPQVGCEHFACWLAVEATDQLQILKLLDRVRVRSARVYEHEGNMAEFTPDHGRKGDHRK